MRAALSRSQPPTGNSQTPMCRRVFLKLAGSAWLGSLLTCDHRSFPIRFPITVDDDLLAGHFTFSGATPFTSSSITRCDTLVVGAGLAGLTAAYLLSDRHVLICELGHVPGGSSAAGDFSGIPFSQGAHYDMEYPDNWGQEVLQLLSELDIITLNAKRGIWEFTDGAHVIPDDRDEVCFSRDEIRSDVLPDDEDTTRFIKWTDQFASKMPLPTRLIDRDLRHLDSVTFMHYMRTCGINPGPEFVAALDYQLMDDYGAGSDTVSALAGIHYYQCRPYDRQDVAYFSPQQGNAYFVERLLQRIPRDSVWVDHAVTGIMPVTCGFQVDVLDVVSRCKKTVLADQIVYAGHKLALKYIYPQDYHLFDRVTYSPWIVVNLLLDGNVKTPYWQNELLHHHPHFLGMINSQGQSRDADDTLLTIYFCLEPSKRADVAHAARFPETWIRSAIRAVETMLEHTLTDRVQAAHIKLHGHGMPIPVPGYLFKDANQSRANSSIAYAGVDNFRLPLLFEAMDSGICAVHALNS